MAKMTLYGVAILEVQKKVSLINFGFITEIFAHLNLKIQVRMEK